MDKQANFGSFGWLCCLLPIIMIPPKNMRLRLLHFSPPKHSICTNAGHTVRRMVHLQPFVSPPYPSIKVDDDGDDNKNHSKLSEVWNTWATTKATFGSYMYSYPSTSNHHHHHHHHHNDTNNKQQQYTTVIHFPPSDLEDESLEGKIYVPTKEVHVSTSTTTEQEKQHSPKVLQQQQQQQHSPPIILTRKGNKYSQGAAIAGGEHADKQLLYRQPNQDRVIMLSRDNTENSDIDDDFWIGLFDGHGPYGHCVSQYASLEFAKRIQQEWMTETEQLLDQDTTKETIKNMFLSINQSIPPLYGSGSTAISIWRSGNLLYISNLGDSVAFVALVRESSGAEPWVDIIYVTKPHKPDSPEERLRIEATGGKVEDAPFPGATARLLIPMSDGIQVFGLAMSRSLGDHDGAIHGLIAEPTTDVLDLNTLHIANKNNEYYILVVAATDGLTDYDRLSEMDVARTMAKAFLSNDTDSPVLAAEQLIMKAANLWAADTTLQGYRDDESIVIQKVKMR
jgi:serine/threonine protein phosphatase PrpC